MPKVYQINFFNYFVYHSLKVPYENMQYVLRYTRLETLQFNFKILLTLQSYAYQCMILHS